MLPEEAHLITFKLNGLESSHHDGPHQIGSWGIYPLGPRQATLGYRTFIPNHLYRPDLMQALCLNPLIRSKDFL